MEANSFELGEDDDEHQIVKVQSLSPPVLQLPTEEYRKASNVSQYSPTSSQSTMSSTHSPRSVSKQDSAKEKRSSKFYDIVIDTFFVRQKRKSVISRQIIEVDVKDTDTVEDVKYKIEQATGIHVSKQNLSLGEIILQDNRYSGDYRLKRESKITAMVESSSI